MTNTIALVRRPELKKAMSQAGNDADSAETFYFDEVETGAPVGV